MKFRQLAAAFIGALVMSACGGGGSDTIARCEGSDDKAWLCAYMDDWYFWYATSPQVSPSAYSTLDSYFNALLYPGDANFPSDRYSYYESTASFDQFFSDGETLGYGVSVAGLEVEGRPDLPLRIRYIEPLSPAAAQGLQRGDEILLINGLAASSYISSGDFSVLSATTAGQAMALRVRGIGGVTRDLTLVATVHALSPVPTATLLTSPLGRRVGYVMVKDMINQVNTPLETAFAQFRAQGVSEVVLDLRYNGGGLVSVGGTVASYIGGSRSSGRDYARLLYNDKRSSNNVTYSFSSPASALGLSRVYVLTGARTCSASEQVINGLSPYVTVVQIGDTTCGKPMGFLPRDHNGNTFSVVNFESVNGLNQGRYFDGLVPNCSVADDLDGALGSAGEGMVAAALQHADTGTCPVFSRRAQPLAARGTGRPLVEPGERQGMWAR